jgi:hypothetical protein
MGTLWLSCRNRWPHKEYERKTRMKKFNQTSCT